MHFVYSQPEVYCRCSSLFVFDYTHMNFHVAGCTAEHEIADSRTGVPACNFFILANSRQGRLRYYPISIFLKMTAGNLQYFSTNPDRLKPPGKFQSGTIFTTIQNRCNLQPLSSLIFQQFFRRNITIDRSYINVGGPVSLVGDTLHGNG